MPTTLSARACFGKSSLVGLVAHSVVLFPLLLTTACRPSSSSTEAATQSGSPHIANEQESFEFLSDNESAYLEVSEQQADTVLVVELEAPGLTGEHSYRFPLKRNPHAKSSMINGIGTGWAADGVADDGTGIGETGSISVASRTERDVTVRFSLSATCSASKRIHVDEKIDVRWLDRAEKQLANGGKVKVFFASPGS